MNMNIIDVLQSGHGSGLARLARAASQGEAFAFDADDTQLVEGVRLAIEHLFKRDVPARSKPLAQAAALLSSLPPRKRCVGHEMIADLLRAACLARTERKDAAIVIVESWREMLRPIVTMHRERALALEVKSTQGARDLEDRARAALLQEEAFELEESFCIIADDVLGNASPAAKPAPVAKPAAPDPVTAVNARIALGESKRAQRKLVLLVDDDEDVRESLGILLEENGYAVVGAENGARAIEALQKGVRPSVILLDLMMPVMSGWDFHKWQLTQPATPPTIVFTATGLKQGALGTLRIVSKNAEPKALLAELQRAAEMLAA